MTHRTTDLALAASLDLAGFKCSEIELLDRRRKTCAWTFATSDGDGPDLHAIVEDYEAGVHEVEPQDFMKSVGRVRGMLYDFLKRNDLRD